MTTRHFSVVSARSARAPAAFALPFAAPVQAQGGGYPGKPVRFHRALPAGWWHRVIGLFVLALHLGVLWLLQAAVVRHHGPGPAPEATRRISVRLLAPSPTVAITQPLPRDEPATAAAARGPARRRAGKGDCLKGESAGTGMGLLSLPFLALAAARSACAP